jgi:hypothetical protein
MIIKYKKGDVVWIDLKTNDYNYLNGTYASSIEYVGLARIVYSVYSSLGTSSDIEVEVVGRAKKFPAVVFDKEFYWVKRFRVFERAIKHKLRSE